ncbi:MAG: hypothetical protein RIB86_08660, partial [Imperialibacter sp.]
MDKLTRYNQKLLAVIGTTVLVGLGLFMLIGGVILVVELSREFNSNRVRDNALTVEVPKDSTAQVNSIRDQEISVGTLQLIDTLNSIYLMPVSQVNLKNPEYPEEIGGLLDTYESGKFRYGYRYSGTYNNIIIYDQKRNTKVLVFHDRINVSAFQHFIVKNEQYLLIEGSKVDTNKDKKLTDADLKSFFSFKISTGELKEFAFESMGLVDYYVTFGSDEVILRFAKDKDG